jgi:cellulase
VSPDHDKYCVLRHCSCFRHHLRFRPSFAVPNPEFHFKNTSKMKSAIVLLAAAASVSAHSTWQDLWVGTTDQVTKCTRTVIDNNPITSLTSADMFCGRSPKATTGVCTVAGKYFKALPQIRLERSLTHSTAGDSLVVEMHAQPGARSCSSPAIGGNHYGPVLVYMAKVSDATSAQSASFFKVAEGSFKPTISQTTN